jgi:hypothetical protein
MPSKFDNYKDHASINWICLKVIERGFKVDDKLQINCKIPGTRLNSTISLANFIGKSKTECINELDKIKQRELQLRSLIL